MKKKEFLVAQITDVTEEYKNNAKPEEGILAFQDGYEQGAHSDEIETARWLHKTFGGNLTLLKESQRQGVKTADYLWNDRLWERKGILSNKFGTIDLRIRKAYGQIMEKRGGIILDFSASRMKMEKIVNYVIKSLKERAHGETDIIIKQGSTYRVLRAKK